MSDNVKDQEMLKLNKLIDAKSYKEAQRALDSSDLAPTIKNFNTGFIFYKSGELVQARAFIEKAKYAGMFSEEATQALQLVREELDLIHIEQEYSTQDHFVLSSASLPFEFYPSIVILCLIVAFFLFWKKLKTFGAILGLSAAVIAIFFIGIKDFEAEFNMDEVSIYSGPSRIFEEVQALPKGVKFISTKHIKNWRYIKYPSIYRGWVYKSKAIKL